MDQHFSEEPFESSYPSHQHHPSHPHPWKARFIVGLIFIVFAFVGLMLSMLWEKGSWDYWRIGFACMIPLALWLSAHTKRKNHTFSWKKFLKELVLWSSLIIIGGIFSLFVHVAVMSSFQASLSLLCASAMTLIIAGVYIDFSFLFTGIALGLFSAGSAYLQSYLYTILLPIAIISIVLLFIFAYYKKQHS